MRIIYTNDEMPSRLSNAIFLAGPTPRDKDTQSWRTEAISYFEKINFQGDIITPEYSSDPLLEDYMYQVAWENCGLEKSTVIMFWVPRDMRTQPGMTTNVEFGLWINSGKVVYGRPNNAENIRYLDWVYTNRQKEQPVTTLQETVAISAAIAISTYDSKPRAALESLRFNMKLLGITEFNREN